MPETDSACDLRAGDARIRRGRSVLAWLAIVSLAAPAQAEVDMETRVGALEARLEALTRRVAGLESAVKETDPTAAAAPGSTGEPAWIFDGYVQGSPFRVLQQALERTSGRVDLLLDVVAQPPDGDGWGSATRGQPVPLVLIAEPADSRAGARTGPVPLVLERVTRIAPGARVHLSASLDPGEARSVRRIRVGHAQAQTQEVR